MRNGKERRQILSKAGMPERKGFTNYARFVAFYSGRVFGQAPGFTPGSVITDFWVRMARRLEILVCHPQPSSARTTTTTTTTPTMTMTMMTAAPERNRLKHQIARMLSDRDSNYYHHLLATGIALPRMITRGGQRRVYTARIVSLLKPHDARAASLLSSFECDLEIASDAQSFVIPRYLRYSFLKTKSCTDTDGSVTG